MKSAALVLLAGCNAVFGLQRTELPPPDAAAVCPPIGQTPVFSTTLRQAVVQSCTGYNISPDRGIAIASCPTYTAGFNSTPAGIGPIDGELARLVLQPTGAYTRIVDYRISPEGDEIFVQQDTDTPGGPSVFSVYARNADDTWSWEQDLPIPAVGALSTPSRGPARHLIVSQAADGMVHEYVRDGASWNEVLPPYSASDLGLNAAELTMSPDGLRAVFETSGSIWYTDRPDLSSRFRHGSVLAGIPQVPDPFMTDDCARLYFSGLASILYVDQQ
ncbi:MAG: hypothetical protein ACM31C_04090 [Acidobacteriota bacterium]